jgi:ACS family hexuronate transporter-like MFS transporter
MPKSNASTANEKTSNAATDRRKYMNSTLRKQRRESGRDFGFLFAQPPASLWAIPVTHVEAPSQTNASKPTKFRWVILFLLFFATTVNYLDRMVMGILATDLQKTFSITDVQYGQIQSAFALSYAAGQLVCGGILDIVGVKAGFAFALIAWSGASIAHAFAKTALGFGLARGVLGVAESPNFPACTKTISEWFPRKERAFAFGFVNAGTNMGALFAPIMVPILAQKFGWQAAFIGTGLIGLLWLLFWLPLYKAPEKHPMVNDAERAYIASDPPETQEKMPWLQLFSYREAWAFALGKFLTDSMWWFYMTWFPKFLNTNHGLNLLTIGVPLVVIYLMADAGSIAGGWLSSSMIKRGATVNRARKTALFICALGLLPVIFAQKISNLWLAIAVLGLATASHQGFSSNLYTLVSDLFPKNNVASVAGFGGTAGYLGASIFQIFVGHMVQGGSYAMPFLCAGLAYLIAFGVIHVLVPTIRQVQPANT